MGTKALQAPKIWITEDQREFIYEQKLLGKRRKQIVDAFNVHYANVLPRTWTVEQYTEFWRASSHRVEFDKYLEDQTRVVRRRGYANTPARVEWLNRVMDNSEVNWRERLDAAKQMGVEMRHRDEIERNKLAKAIEVVWFMGFGADDPMLEFDGFCNEDAMLVELLERRGKETVRQISKARDGLREEAEQLLLEAENARKEGIAFPHDPIDVEVA